MHCERLDPEALLEALKTGRYYSTQGPALEELVVDGERLNVKTSEAYAITLTERGDRWLSGEARTSQDGEAITRPQFDLSPFSRVILPHHGRRSLRTQKANFREFPLCEVRAVI